MGLLIVTVTFFKDYLIVRVTIFKKYLIVTIYQYFRHPHVYQPATLNISIMNLNLTRAAPGVVIDM